MSYQATVYRIMIASPSDVNDERLLFRDIINEWNAIHSEEKAIVLLPISWETHSSPEIGRPQGIISDQVLSHADLLVAAFWTRIGTPTGKEISGTVEEINDHIKAGKQAMLYFSNAHVPPSKIDDKQLKAVKKLKKQYEKTSLFNTYDDLGSLRTNFTRHLSLAVQRHFVPETLTPTPERIEAELKASPSITNAAKELLLRLSQDSNLELMVVRTKSGLSAHTAGLDLVEPSNPRDEVKLMSAIQELVTIGYIRDKSNGRGQFYTPTQSGLDLVDSLVST
ncbi:hypothetical protein A6C57_01095 [Fibrella sp. ES10-3-2-2]|nr:hypothetical protein A6C57_01095 [Fibrella sp. ES10-3-2-2]